MLSDNEWLPENLDEGHLDYYFLLLAGLMVLTHVSDDLMACCCGSAFVCLLFTLYCA